MKDQRITLMFPVNYLGSGGAEQQLLELVRGIDKSRFEPVVVTLYPGGPLDEQVREVAGAELITLNRRGKYDFHIIGKVLGLLRRRQVDIVQPFLTPATFFGMLPAVIGRTRVKVVTQRSGLSEGNRMGYSIYLAVEDFLTRFADCVVANSEAGRRYLVERGIAPSKIIVIYNGINTERLTPDPHRVGQIRAQLGISGEGRIVGITARLHPAKDHATFLRAAKIVSERVPETRFAIVGHGKERRQLEELAAQLGVSHVVRFLGYQRDIGSYISAYDVACLSSKGVEGCSNVTLEAMALGKPVVVTDIGGNRELVEPGITGFVVPAESPREMANAILTCLEDLDQALEMGRRARSLALNRFTQERMVNEYQALYEELIATKCAKSSVLEQGCGVDRGRTTDTV